MLQIRSDDILYDEMANDTTHFECSRAKKSKTQQMLVEFDCDTDKSILASGRWNCLPEDILREIFSYLNFSDVISASSACINWRQSLYFARYWRNVNFIIEPQFISRAQYYRLAAGHSIVNTSIKFNSLSKQCVTELYNLLGLLSTNNNLKSFMLEPTHCHIETPEMNQNNSIELNPPLLSSLLYLICNHPLQRLSLGLSEELLQHVPQYLNQLALNQPGQVNTLGLASLKDDPLNYLICSLEPELLTPFRKLQILSIDYDNMNDQLLHSLEGMFDLKRLVVHVHGIWDGHPGTSEYAWGEFKARNPKCLLRLSLIHAYDEVAIFHDAILRRNMPLSHLKVLFCEHMNIAALNKFWEYNHTLTSLMWIDSHNTDENGYSYEFLRYEQSALVMLAWRCTKLEELSIIGYKHQEIDWLGVSRLRSNTLRVVDYVYEDVVFSGDELGEFCSSQQVWLPRRIEELHPVLSDPTAGDSDEYLMPILHADIR